MFRPLRRFAALFVVVLAIGFALGACATPSGSGQGPSAGTAGAPAVATQGAQNIGGSQGQAPATATGGTAAVNFNFASQIPGTLADGILKMADAQKWTPEQLQAVFRSTNGAPQSVTITTAGNTSQGGNASSIPAAGSGGSAGVQGGVGKP